MNEYADSMGIYKLAVLGMPATFAPSQASLLTRWNSIGTGNPLIGVLANSGNRGNPALYLPFGAAIGKTFTHQTTYTIGFRLNMGCVAGVGNATVPLIEFGAIGAGALILASLLVKADGSILVFGNGLLGTPIFTTPIAVVANTDCVLEFSAMISGTTN